jgi:hypothetical protein
LGFSVKDLSEQEKALFEGEGKIMRHVKFYSLEDADDAIVEVVEACGKKGCELLNKDFNVFGFGWV